jgi:triosephosphate isomerase
MIIPEGNRLMNTKLLHLRKRRCEERIHSGKLSLRRFNWVFVDQVSVLVKKGYEPPIHDFAITCHNEDITDRILGDEGYTMLMICDKIEDAPEKKLAEVSGLAVTLKKTG